jgi:hypothetical protein
MPGHHRAPDSLALSRTQRSHLLFILSGAVAGQEAKFVEWYRGPFRRAMLDSAGVLALQLCEQHEVDISQGVYTPFALRYLAICELSLDGAQEGAGVIERINSLHRQQVACADPATWLYYPVSERVGRSPTQLPSLLTLAFANGLPGREAEFREWYVTRHIRHALNIPALVSGQCFQRTEFQQAGALPAAYDIIAMYEQEGTADSIMESLASLPKGALDFPAADWSRFTEWVYRPV